MIKKILTATIAATLGAATVSYAASGPTVFPHGIASSAPVVTPEGVTQGTIGDTVTLAKGAIPEAEKNSANGVAGLDASGSTTSPLDTDGSVSAKSNVNLGWRPTISGAPVGGWPTSWWTQTPKITFGVKPDGMADDMILFGGHGLFDGMSAKIYSVPYNNGDNSGCIFSEEMSFAPLTGATCGSGVFDAVGHFNLASNNPPYYEVGQDITGSDGVTHTVTFTATTAVITPALPSDFGQIFKKSGMHVITNVVGGDPIPSGVQNLPGPDHRSLDPQYYRGTITGFTNIPASGTAPSKTILNLGDGWNLANQTNGTHIPSPGTGSDSLDQVLYARYTHPILLIGTYLKAFAYNTRTQLNGDINASDGSARAMAESPARSAEGDEVDQAWSGPDYGATFHGLTISGVFRNAVGSDSYGISVNGNYPTGYRAWIGQSGTDFDGDAFAVGPRLAPTETIGSTALMVNLRQQTSSYTGDGSFTDLKTYRQLDTIGYGQPNATHSGFIDYSIHTRAYSGGGKYTVGGAGVEAGSDFIINPSWAKYGFGFCPGNNETAGNGSGCFSIYDDGSVLVGGKLTVSNGMPYIDLIPTTGSGGTPRMQATGPYEVSVLNKNGGYSAVVQGDTTVKGHLTATGLNTTTTGGSHFACIDDAGNFYRSNTACVQ